MTEEHPPLFIYVCTLWISIATIRNSNNTLGTRSTERFLLLLNLFQDRIYVFTTARFSNILQNRHSESTSPVDVEAHLLLDQRHFLGDLGYPTNSSIGECSGF